jgi:hypothetical protein
MATIEKGYDQARVFNQVMQIIEKYSGPEELYAVGEPIMCIRLSSLVYRSILKIITYCFANDFAWFSILHS